MSLRLIFAGSPETALPSFYELRDSAHQIVGVLTRTDAPRGRKHALTPTPVAVAATDCHIPIIKANRPETVTDELIALRADIGVVVAYGGFFREPLLSAPKHGWLNLHFSLLPSWRGAAPVQHAIIAGDPVSGVSVFRLVAEMDAGPLYAQSPVEVAPEENAGELLERLSVTGAGVLRRVMDDIAAGCAETNPQRGEVSFAPKLGGTAALIDWNMPAERLSAQIRGVTPEPGAVAFLGGQRLKIHRARVRSQLPALSPGAIAEMQGLVCVGTADFPLELLVVQASGKRSMSAIQWWRGRPRQ